MSTKYIHAPSHVRQPFQEAIEEGLMPPPSSVQDLLECADIMPGHLCDELGLAHGSTFGEGAASLT